MTVYRHGVYIGEVDTPIVPTRRVDSSLPVFVGTAPLWKTSAHRTDGDSVPILALNFAEAESWLGYDSNWTDYTLCEAMQAFFQIYGMGPAVFINAFNPYGNAAHRNAQTTYTQALVGGSLKMTNTNVLEGVLIDNVVVKNQGATVTYVKDTDYTIAYDADYHVVVTRIVGGAITTDTTTLTLLYETAKPAGVLAADIVTALGVVDQVYPMHTMVPGQIVAPLWSIDTSVASAMLARALDINDSFRCLALVDIDTDAATGADLYTEVNTEKTTNSWSDPHMVCCWPKVTAGGATYHLSTHMAAVIARTDYDNGGVPYVSPSNHALQITGAVTKAGGAIYLGRDQANVLNGQGVVTALNWEGGWQLWGNRTSDYPSSTDPKDTFIPNRRMMDWIGNTCVSTFFRMVDAPITRRTISTIQESLNDWLSGLVGQGALLSGECQLLESDNPATSLLDGQVTFRVNLGLPGPAEVIVFTLAMDPNALSVLWA